MWTWLWANIQTISVGFGMIGGLWVGFNRIRPRLRRLWIMLSLAESIDTSLTEIRKELKPHQGASLRELWCALAGRFDVMESYIRATVEQAPTATFRSDKNGLMIDANQAFCKMVDTGRDKLLGNGWLTFVYVDDRDEVYTEWKNSVAQERDFSMEFRLQVPGRRPQAVRGAATILKAGSNVIGLLGSITPL